MQSHLKAACLNYRPSPSLTSVIVRLFALTPLNNVHHCVTLIVSLPPVGLAVLHHANRLFLMEL